MPTARFSHLSCCICLESIENRFWFGISRDNSVNVIRPGIECKEGPASDLTRLSDRLFDSRSSPRAKLHRRLLEGSQVVFSPLLVGRNARAAITIMETIYRTSSVAMKPSAISSKRDEVSKRNVFSSKLTVRGAITCALFVGFKRILALPLRCRLHEPCHSTAEQEAVATWPVRFTQFLVVLWI